MHVILDGQGLDALTHLRHCMAEGAQLASQPCADVVTIFDDQDATGFATRLDHLGSIARRRREMKPRALSSYLIRSWRKKRSEYITESLGWTALKGGCARLWRAPVGEAPTRRQLHAGGLRTVRSWGVGRNRKT